MPVFPGCHTNSTHNSCLWNTSYGTFL